ncbi:MAG: MinD/ParA family protein [Candidatus Bathyarchaeia archaeon]|nr:MinD/ParA family protein [Candidatus Bathyarchaeota archaeon]
MDELGLGICLHSYKGGTGKTTIAANIAAYLAGRGLKICILDYDFRAPSLHIIFKENPKRWVNDYLNGRCEFEDVLHKLSGKYRLGGELTAGFADPSSEALRDMLAKDRKWEMNALKRTIKAKRTVLDDLGYDLFILDTSPGIQYSSVNAVVASDQVLLVMKGDEFDLEGTRELVKGVYEPLGRRAKLIINKIPVKEVGAKLADETVAHIVESLNLELLGRLPCDCILMFEGGKHLFVLENEEHPFSKSIEEIAEKIRALTRTPS